MANLDLGSAPSHEGESNWTDSMGGLRENIGAIMSAHPEGDLPSSTPDFDAFELDNLRIVFSAKDGSGAVTLKDPEGAVTYHINTDGKVQSVDYLGSKQAGPDEDPEASLMQALQTYIPPRETQE